MDKLARRVAARWAFKEAMGDWQPAIPIWVVPWADLQAQRVLVGKRRLQPHELQFRVTDPDVTRPADPPVFTPGDPLNTNPNRVKYEQNWVYNPKLHEMPERVVHPGQDLFDDAKLSLEIMLPKVLQTLGKKFRDRFYMNATQQRMKLYYYFSGHPALETIALTLAIQGGHPVLWVGYIPNKLVGGADFQRGIHESVVVRDPELAGLALMRLLRKLLDRIE